MGNRGSIIVSVHADDEIYMFSSFVFNYPFKIIMHVPFLSDMALDDASRANQYCMLMESVSIINDYRKEQGFDKLLIGYKGDSYKPNGFANHEFTDFVRWLEESIKEFDQVDYFLRTCNSTHQNHCHAYTASNAVLRSPYIDRINCILTASYPTDFSVGDVGRNTVFQDMDAKQVDTACRILEDVYLDKVLGRSTLSSESFRTMLRFMGSVSQNEYAAAYQLDRERIYGAKYNKTRKLEEVYYE